MVDEKNLREQMQRIDGLVRDLESVADPAVRAMAKDLVQSLMDLHGAALDKAMEIVSESGESGMAIIDTLGCDSLVSSVLILYGLHPEDLETRVAKAVARVTPQLRKQGCEAELLGAGNGVVRVHVQTGGHACGSTAKDLQAKLEGAIYDAAPDMISLEITGFEEKPASGFVALDKLLGQMTAHPVVRSSSLSGPSLVVEPRGMD